MTRTVRTLRWALLGTLLSTLLTTACTREKRSEGLAGAVFPNAPVILISIDTLRSDHLPAYGYKGVETPNLDRFRKDAILFEQAFSHCPLTFPSHITMLTGLLPAGNGVRDNIGFHFDAAAQPTLPGVLKSKGYRTGAAVSSYVLRGKTGLGAAFDFYDDAVEVRPGSAQGSLQRSGTETAAIARRWIEQNPNEPFLFMLHLFEPHAPYTPPPPFAGRYPLAYDGEIAATDQIVGELLDALRTSGIYEKAIVIILSDHGEGLMDHGEQEHGIFLYREAIQVPLLLKLPGSRDGGKSIPEPVGLVDLFPTIARLVDAPVPSGLAGSSLLETPAKPRAIFSETIYPRLHLGWSELRSLVGGGHHFIEAPRAELYDLKADPRGSHQHPRRESPRGCIHAGSDASPHRSHRRSDQHRPRGGAETGRPRLSEQQYTRGRRPAPRSQGSHRRDCAHAGRRAAHCGPPFRGGHRQTEDCARRQSASQRRLESSRPGATTPPKTTRTRRPPTGKSSSSLRRPRATPRSASAPCCWK